MKHRARSNAASRDLRSCWLKKVVLCEYGTIDEYDTQEGDEGVVSLFNLDEEPHYMRQRFAHPEFFYDDPNIGDSLKDYFTIDATMED